MGNAYFFLLKTSMCMKTTHNGTSIRKHETDWNQRWLFAIKKILVMYSKANEI